MNCAPVLIPTLCRDKHFKVCVKSLARNSLAKDTIVFIALDYPLKEEHWEGYRIIKSYLDEVKTKNYFSELVVIERRENLGSVKNFSEASNFIFSHYNSLIFSEDDNEFSTNFLEYMNKSLSRYENDKSIMGITGYALPVQWKYAGNSVLKLPVMSAWGLGIWKDRYFDFFERTAILQDAKVPLKFDFFKQIYQVSPPVWAYFINCFWMRSFRFVDWNFWGYMILSKKKAISPVVSKVINHGLDGSGVSKMLDPLGYGSVILDKVANFEFVGDDSLFIDINQKLFQQFYSYYKIGRLFFLKSILKYIFGYFRRYLR